MLSHLPVWWGTSCIEPVLYRKPFNFPCPALIAWNYRECLGELVHLSIGCSLALVCWLICFLWEVTSRFYFYITKLRHTKSEPPKGVGVLLFFSSYVGLCAASFVYPKNIWKIRHTPKKYFLKLDFMRRLARAFDRPNSEMKSHTLGAHSQTAEAKKIS